jgi:hypothetical protein
MAGSSYTQNEILFRIDLSRFKKIASQPNFNLQMKIKLADYITNDQFMVLDIINSNVYNRPIYFAATYDLFAGYLERQGLIYQLFSLDSTKAKQTEKISVAKIESFLKEGFKATPSNNFSSGLVTNYNQDAITQSMFTDVFTKSPLHTIPTCQEKWRLKNFLRSTCGDHFKRLKKLFKGTLASLYLFVVIEREESVKLTDSVTQISEVAQVTELVTDSFDVFGSPLTAIKEKTA